MCTMSGTHGFCWCYFSFSQAMFHCWGTCVASCQDLHVCPLYPSYLLSLHELYYTFLIMFLAELIYLAPDTYGLFNYLLPGPSFYSKIEGLSALVSFA